MPESATLRLKLRDPSGGERELVFTGELVRIGRAHDCEVVLESGFISRYHARLERRDDGWQVFDEGSKNGVFVNGQRVTSAGSQFLHPGDALRIGDFGLTVEAVTPDEDLDRTIIIPPSPRASRPSAPEAAAPVVTEPEREASAENEAAATAPEGQEQERPHAAVTEEPEAAAAEQLSASAQEPQAAAREPASAAEEPQAGAVAVPVETEAVETPSARAIASRTGQLAAPAPVAATTTAGLVVDPDQRTVSLNGKPLQAALSPWEIDLLVALTTASRACTSAELIDAIWGPGGGDEEMLDRLARRVQLKLGCDGEGFGLLVRASASGYRLGGGQPQAA